MDTQEAIYRAITGGKGSGSAPPATSVPEMISNIMRAADDSPSRAARIAGIPDRTWRYLRGGRQPSAANLDRLRSAQRAIRVSERRQRWLRTRPGPHVVIAATVRISSDIRNRKMYISGWPRIPNAPDEDQVAGIMARTFDKWLTGNDQATEQTFMRPVNAGVSHEVELLRVFGIRLFKKRSEALRYISQPMDEE